MCLDRSLLPELLPDRKLVSSHKNKMSVISHCVFHGQYIDSIRMQGNNVCHNCIAIILSRSEWAQYEVMKETNPGCSFDFVGRRMLEARAGFAMNEDHERCTYLVRNAWDIYFQEMELDGTAKALWDKFIRKTKDQDCVRVSASNPTSMGIKNVAGPFVLILFASAAAIFTSHAPMMSNIGANQPE